MNSRKKMPMNLPESLESNLNRGGMNLDNAKELRQVYDIFTAAWLAYREHYPPENPQDDTYWSKLVDDLHKIESQYNCQLCRDILCNVASDLAHKAKVLYQSK